MLIRNLNLLAISVLVAAQVPAFAQTAGPDGQGNAAGQPPPDKFAAFRSCRYTRDTGRYKAVGLTKVPTVPGIPTYTGAVRFDGGIKMPENENGSVVDCRFSCNQTLRSVHDWYLASLLAYGWQIESDSTGYITAIKGQHSSCEVSITDTGDPEFRTEVNLSGTVEK